MEANGSNRKRVPNTRQVNRHVALAPRTEGNRRATCDLTFPDLEKPTGPSSMDLEERSHSDRFSAGMKIIQTFPRFFRSHVRGLRRWEAAAYAGVSPTKFDGWVQRGIMPAPLRVDGCVIWDIRMLDAAFDALVSSQQLESDTCWDEVSV